jgi:hypothetical protein
MKNFIAGILIAVSTLTAPAFAQDASAQKPQWVRDNDNYYSYYAFSEGNYQINAQMRLSEARNQQNKLIKYVDFRLVWSNKDFCGDYEEHEGVITESTYYVNDQAIQFNVTCFKGEYVNIYPADDEKGKKHLMKIFNKARGKNVRFVKRSKDGQDIVYGFPSLAFSQFYSELNKATKSSI